VPGDAPSINIERNISVFNDMSSEGHCEVRFTNVRVPVANLLGEEGSGFTLARARLGPGRFHHCMRSIGAAELALELMLERAGERKAFGKSLNQDGTFGEWIARSRTEIDEARLLVLKTAWLIDNVGAGEAHKEISMVKALVPTVDTNVCDRAMQGFGAMQLSPDTPLADHRSWGRALRGPDEVYLQTVDRMGIRRS
jgi:acyl-CoA dehydrogenase